MKIQISVVRDGEVLAQTQGDEVAALCYEQAYRQGDEIRLYCEENMYLWLQLEDSFAPALVYCHAGEFSFPIPFEEKRVCYSQKAFTGTCHLIFARCAVSQEIAARRNLALNPLDHHENNSVFPHAKANVETRGEAWFAARNAIDGNIASAGHGLYPFESWGINRREDAELTVYFGRPVRVDELVVTLRADFPHDNWWKEAEFVFSDGSKEVLHFQKSGLPQRFAVQPRTTEFVTICNMKKDETDPSPFPALTQLEVWGTEV